MEIATELAARTGHFLAMCAQTILGTLFAPGSSLSVYSLAFAFVIASAAMLHGRRATRFKSLRKVMFPKRWLSGPSARADWGFAVFNIFIAYSLVGWAIVSSGVIAPWVTASLVQHAGPITASVLPAWLAMSVATAAIYLAYEAAYFIDHYLSHHIPFLWHFHRTHHTAETLSPLTNYRVHPVDSIVFYNFVGVFVGVADGVTAYWFKGTGQITLFGGNAILIVALYLLTHLHHSHIWIAFTGTLGHWVMSPAHHQLHHSDDPAHHNRNFGHTLGVFDWLAGTLLVPTAKRTRLTFGSGAYAVDPHGITGGLIQPFTDAFEFARPRREATTVTPRSELAGG